MEAWKTKEYTTMTFCDVFDEAEDFLSEWKNSGLYESGLIDDTIINKIYFLLYARYANRPILNLDLTQWKYKVFSIIFAEGPTWAKRLDIQKSLRNLTDADLRAGSKAIYNHAMNPSADPSTSTLEELNYINDQNTTNYKRGKLEAYNMLIELLNTDVTTSFIAKFEKCFSKFINHRPLLYVTDLVEDEDDDE